MLARNAASDYGRRFGFARIRSAREYQEATPIVRYQDLEREIAAIRAGRQGVLTEERVLMLEKTSGSTAAAKYIPYTESLKREFQRAVALWMMDLYAHRPRMLFGGSYWSVSPLASEAEVSPGGLPVGFADESAYFGAFERLLLRKILLTPPELPQIRDTASSRYVTLRFLLATSRLSFISVWNPSFLTLLVRFLWDHHDRLTDDLERGTLRPPGSLPAALQAALARRLRPLPRRAACVRQLFRGNSAPLPIELWPSLAVISCWGSASAKLFLPELEELFPSVEIQPKGLLATEGVVSIPLTGHPGGAPALTSHFFEFVPEEGTSHRPLLVEELELGSAYRVLITTGGGLYRYDLGDRVRVVGRIAATPLVEFVGRAGAVSDLCGEKLDEESVREILAGVFGRLGLKPNFALLAPEWGEPPHYVLFLQTPSLPPGLLKELESAVEAELIKQFHYGYCRRLGQLGAVRALALRDGASRLYLERCAALGQRQGDVKPTVLHPRTGWTEWLRERA